MLKNALYQRLAITVLLTIMALIAFAANSVLCRLALGNDLIDASGFTIVRLLSGALVLFLLITINRQKREGASAGSWFASSMLFLYAISFSYAYITLETGTGALILFGAVQITMIVIALFSGNRLHVLEWLGVFIAFSGFVYLVMPGVTAPPLNGFVLMSLAGIAWGIYTIKGKSSKHPLIDTCYNFIRTIPLIIVLLLITINHFQYSYEGVVLAVMSGGIASGIGYAIWYSALRGLNTTQAAVVQLSVPVIAAIGGVIFVSEPITQRLVISSLLILGGILVVVFGRHKFASNKT